MKYFSGLPPVAREKLAETYDDPNTRRYHEWTFELVARFVQSHPVSGNPLAILKQVTDAGTKELADITIDPPNTGHRIGGATQMRFKHFFFFSWTLQFMPLLTEAIAVLYPKDLSYWRQLFYHHILLFSFQCERCQTWSCSKECKVTAGCRNNAR